jgi:YVTN family beta-propeller protein
LGRRYDQPRLDEPVQRNRQSAHRKLHPNSLVGSTPIALARSATANRLYVANADNNDVAVIDIAEPGRSRILGFIPTGWYPCALALSADNRLLFIGASKGMSSKPNPEGTYIGSLLTGHVSILPVPNDQQLAKYTRQVEAN